MISIFFKTSIELALVLLLIYGFMHEKQMIELEQLLFRAAVIKIKLYRKHRALARMRKNREFKLVDGRKSVAKAQQSTLYVA